VDDNSQAKDHLNLTKTRTLIYL